MQPTRRSARLNRIGSEEAQDSTASQSAPADTPAPRVSRVYARKRLRNQQASSSQPPQDQSDQRTEVLSASESDSPIDDSDQLFPKGPRYAASREAFQAQFDANPELLRPKQKPVNARFSTEAAMGRFRNLIHRKFVDQQLLPLEDKRFTEVKKVIKEAGLIYTVVDADPYYPNVVREFVANALDGEERNDGIAVYVRGSLVEFSPSLINKLYRIPPVDEDPQWENESIDRACAFVSANRVRRWENMMSKYLTKTNQVLYKLVCSNWFPTTNYTTMNPARLKFLYMLQHQKRFDFGSMVYNQIISLAESTGKDRLRRIIFPNLIQQVILCQRTIPPDASDGRLSRMPKMVVMDHKAGRGTGADSSSLSLVEDIDKAIVNLKAIRRRLMRGEYELPVPPILGENEGDEESEEDGDED